MIEQLALDKQGLIDKLTAWGYKNPQLLIEAGNLNFRKSDGSETIEIAEIATGFYNVDRKATTQPEEKEILPPADDDKFVQGAKLNGEIVKAMLEGMDLTPFPSFHDENVPTVKGACEIAKMAGIRTESIEKHIETRTNTDGSQHSIYRVIIGLTDSTQRFAGISSHMVYGEEIARALAFRNGIQQLCCTSQDELYLWDKPQAEDKADDDFQQELKDSEAKEPISDDIWHIETQIKVLDDGRQETQEQLVSHHYNPKRLLIARIWTTPDVSYLLTIDGRTFVGDLQFYKEISREMFRRDMQEAEQDNALADLSDVKKAMFQKDD